MISEVYRSQFRHTTKCHRVYFFFNPTSTFSNKKTPHSLSARAAIGSTATPNVTAGDNDGGVALDFVSAAGHSAAADAAESSAPNVGMECKVTSSMMQVLHLQTAAAAAAAAAAAVHVIIYNISQGNISFRLITLAFDIARSDAEDAAAHEHGSSGEEEEDAAGGDGVREKDASGDDMSSKHNAQDVAAVSPPLAPASEKPLSGDSLMRSRWLPL